MSNNQRVPVGFLELLGIKAAGLTLPQSSEFLQPTMEMRDFYGSILWGAGIASVVAGAAPATATLTVPDGEIWFLNSVVQITNVAIGSTRLHQRIFVAPIGSGPGAIVESAARDFPASAAILTFDLAWQPPFPWILRPGSTIYSAVIEIEPAAVVDNFTQAMFYRVPF